MSVTPEGDVTIMETREASPTHFLIKIESFYKSGMDKFETNEFVAGDYKWRLIIHPNGDGTAKYCDYVSVYLAMADTSSRPANWEVTVVFSIFLFNQISANYLCSLGITRRFLAMKSEWGFSKLISKKVLSEPSNGYLIDDTCVLGAEVFIVKKEAAIQRLSLNNCDVPYERDWKITNFSKLGNLWESEEFTVRGHKWNIWLYPNGNSEGVGTHVSLYLLNAGYERVQASYTLCIRNLVSDEHKKLTITNHLFTPSSSSWGWPTFMKIATLNDPKMGFIVNDSCLVHVEISSVGDAAQ